MDGLAAKSFAGQKKKKKSRREREKKQESRPRFLLGITFSVSQMGRSAFALFFLWLILDKYYLIGSSGQWMYLQTRTARYTILFDHVLAFK